MTNDFATDEFLEEGEDGSLVFGLDTEGFDDDSLYKGGGTVDKDGKYHVQCIDVKNDTKDGKLPCVLLTLQVLAGTEKDQVEKKHFHRIYLAKWEKKPNEDKGIEGVKAPLEENARVRLARFARAFRVLSDEDMDNPNAKINFLLFRDRQAIVEIKKGDDQMEGGKVVYAGRHEIPWNNAWPLNHPDVENVPKDPEALQLIGGVDGYDAAPFGDDDLDDI